jgi:hypothetical protein
VSQTEAPQHSEKAALHKRFEAVLMPNYGVPPVAISRGRAAGSGARTGPDARPARRRPPLGPASASGHHIKGAKDRG